MEFRIADTFTDSLARLTDDEQKAVKTTAFDLQLNPASPGMSFHRLDKAKDKSFWSVRVNRDIRLIVHKSEGSLMLCYVDHHDKAYRWAECRKLETHPKTGAAQMVEIRETVQEILIPSYVAAKPSKSTPSKGLLFANLTDDDLLGYGVPAEWLNDVRQANEDSLLVLADRLPSEASEALLEIATGGKPRTTAAATKPVKPFEHPDALRRFRVMSNLEELERALEFPWDKWSIFLHPDQRQIVERAYTGPARICGSAGTGKTIVAVHRAVFLARTNPNTRILLTTFSHILANALRIKLRRLISNEPRLAERLEVHSINAIGGRLYKAHFGPANLAPHEVIVELLGTAAEEVPDHKFTAQFLLNEWEQVVDASQSPTWESYRDAARLGRKSRLTEPQRQVLWQIFEKTRVRLNSKKLITLSEMFTKLAAAIEKDKSPPFDFVVVDEAQDMGIAHLRFLAAIGSHRVDALFFAGDLGQRIFQQPFSWLALGVDIRGRSRNLRVNYRTSHQIRTQADRLLGPEVTDADGNSERRGETVSLFNGPPTEIVSFESEAEEITAVAKWISARAKEGILPQEVGVFVRSPAQLDRARAAIGQAGMTFKILDENVETANDHASVSTMHLAKGLEFRAVAVMACDDEVIPLQERIETVSDEGDLKDVYDTERHLLYVACTRARDHLLVTCVKPASEFLDDLVKK
jgi:mRNA-degrading endonuclease RelE of RelBE toxin-antitoxin system